jgi:hypothetical protein
MAFHTRTDETASQAPNVVRERPSWLASYRLHVRARVRVEDASLWGDALARYLGRARLVAPGTVSRLLDVRGHEPR